MKLSIITINWNNSVGLSETIQSVVNQTASEFEYIIIDGASTDSSKDLIEQLAESDKRLTYWCSEPDSGIYNAMNKGIVKSKSEYILFLNSGDSLADENVVRDFIAAQFKEDVVSGNVKLMYPTNPELRYSPEPEDINYGLFFGGGGRVVHQSTFIRRVLFGKYGLYNENNKIVSDWEFFYNVLVFKNSSYRRFDRLICCYDMTGLSAQDELQHIQDNEIMNFHNINYPRIYNSYKKLYDDNIFKSNVYSEYLNLKKGKLGFIIKIILWIKLKLKN